MSEFSVEKSLNERPGWGCLIYFSKDWKDLRSWLKPPSAKATNLLMRENAVYGRRDQRSTTEETDVGQEVISESHIVHICMAGEHFDGMYSSQAPRSYGISTVSNTFRAACSIRRFLCPLPIENTEHAKALVAVGVSALPLLLHHHWTWENHPVGLQLWLKCCNSVWIRKCGQMWCSPDPQCTFRHGILGQRGSFSDAWKSNACQSDNKHVLYTWDD